MYLLLFPDCHAYSSGKTNASNTVVGVIRLRTVSTLLMLNGDVSIPLSNDVVVRLRL